MQIYTRVYTSVFYDIVYTILYYILYGICVYYIASFYAIFLKNCGRSYGRGTATCHRTVVGGKQGHAPCKIPSLQ